MEKFHWPIALVFLSFLFIFTGAQTTPTTQQLYVKPTEYTPCPEPCYTLDQYMQNATRYFVSNTVFNFLPGMHPMRQALSVCNISNLSMVTTSGTAKITCQSYTELSFSEIYNLTMRGLTFSSCISLLLNDVFDLNLLRVSVQNLDRVSTGPFLTATNILGTSIIEDFTYLLLNESNTQEQSIFIHFTDSSIHSSVPHHHLTIKRNVFGCSVPHRCWGLYYISLFQSKYDVDVVFENTTFINTDYSIFIAILSDTRNNISILNSHFKSSGSIYVEDKSPNTREMVASSSQIFIANCCFENSTALSFYLKTTELSITKCSLKQMVAPQKSYFPPSAGLQLSSRAFLHERSQYGYKMGTAIAIVGASSHVLIQDVTFGGASSTKSAATLFHHAFADTLSLTVANIINAENIEFKNCRFSGNYRVSTLAIPPAAVVLLTRSHNVSFSNCEFTNNGGTAVAAYDSTFILRGTNSFVNNSAYEGGALGFYGSSLVQLEKDTEVLFQNNSAETVGGAIMVLNYYIPTASVCFFRLPYVHAQYEFNCTQYQMKTNVRFSFVNNTAQNGGDDIYGASLDLCAAQLFLGGCKHILDDILSISGTDKSAVTSHPLRVCLCNNGQPDCTEIFSNLSCYPGQNFNLPAVIVGDTFGTVGGSAFAFVLPQSSSSNGRSLGELQESQQLYHQQCSNLTYSVHSNTSEVALVLSATTRAVKSYPTESDLKAINLAINDYNSYGTLLPILRTVPIFINVTLIPCPLGFVLSEESHGCICDPQLEENNIPCNLTTQTVRRSGTVWVNASFKDGRANGVIVNNHCPHYYCKREAVNVDLEYPDTQCAFHRSGILCGGCPSGLSLTLGSAQCLPCSNHFLALLIPFAVAGFALVFFLKVLNLTVAVGTINGLIFYANIVQANQDEWLPAEHNILTAFIAWFNLDLGIETCFFDGLDSYWKTWLQFIFPLYIWVIIVMLIVIAHFYFFATKLFGGNSVPVLATLFLLSYTKLLRAITAMLQFSTLEHPDGTTSAVWTYDSNIPYLSPRHIPMFIIALLLLAFLGVPYTVFLLFSQCIQRIDSQILRRVLIRLKPFLDAYFGPLQDKHRYWVGLLLLVRCVLITVISATPTNKSSVTLVILVVAVCSLIMYPYVGQVYKWNCLNLLENSLFLNLGILALGTLYIQASGGNQAALAYTCVGVAFAQFITIIVFHTATAIKSMGLLQSFTRKKAPDLQNSIHEDSRQLNAP